MFFPEVGEIKTRETPEGGLDFEFDGVSHIMGENGELKELTELESIKEWIKKVVLTVKGSFEVYTRDERKAFGVSIYDHLGEKNADYWKAEHEREIKTQLTEHPSIAEIKDVSVERSMRRLTVYFTVVMVDGTVLDDKVFL